MRRLSALALTLLLVACDGGAPEAPSDASAVVGAWGLVRSQEATDVTSPVDQTLTDYATVTDARVTVTGTDVPPLVVRRTRGGGSDVGFWALLESADGVAPSARLELAATEQEVRVNLTTYDPALEASGDAFRSYETQRLPSAVTRDGGRYTLAPVQLAGDDGSTVTVEATVAFDTERVGAGETVAFVRQECEGDGVRGNRRALFLFEADGTYTFQGNDRAGWAPCYFSLGSLVGPPAGTWTYEAGELRLDGRQALRLRKGGGQLYLDQVLSTCTSGACLQYGDWSVGWETDPSSIVHRYTNTFADDR